jgi:hypothetical protein
MADYLSFKNIYETIEKMVTNFQNMSRRDELKALINMVYLDEVMVCDDLYPPSWLMDLIDNVKTKDSATITGISKADPGVVSAVHTFVAGDIVQIDGVVGMTEVNHRTFVVGTVVAGTSFQLLDLAGTNVNTSSYTAWSSGGTVYHRGTTLSKAFTRVHSFTWHSYNGQVEPISINKMSESANWTDPGNHSRPLKHLHKPYFSTAGVKTDRLMWYPLPNDDESYEARIWGELDVSPMSDDAHVPQLPFRFHNAIISGTIARLLEYGQVQIENAVIWPGLYKMQIEAIKSYNRKWWKQFEKDERSGLYLL